MKNTFSFGAFALLLTLLTGCMSAPFEPPLGLFSDVQAPLSIDHARTAVTSKKGTAKVACYLGLVSVGDASTQAAAENGHLKVIHHLDYKYLNVLGLYQSVTVIAYGE